MIRNIYKIIRFISKDSKLSDNYRLTEDQISTILKKPKFQPKQVLAKIDTNTHIAVEEQQKQLMYGLSVTNQPFPIVYDQQQTRVILETPTQNLFQALQLTSISSFEDYQIRLESTYHNQLDMYGDVQQTPQIKFLEFKKLLVYDSKYLQDMRKRNKINLNMPGSIQNEDPHNFLQLRPVEQFRHTPLIPINQTAMRKHKEMLEQYHRRAFVFEVSSQSIINWALFIVAFSVCGYLIREVLKKEEQNTVNYQRLKYKRLMGDDEKKLLF